MGIWGNTDEVGKRPKSDRSIARRIRRRIRRVCSYPDALHVTVHDHVVAIEGPIVSRERELVIVAAGDVSGVTSVRDRLTVHSEAGTVPELQGRPRGGPDRRRAWSAGLTRFVLLLLGLGLFLGASRAARRS
jgi:hypothetical protein